MTTDIDQQSHWPVLAEGVGGTVIACDCGQAPKKSPERMSMYHVWHARHRKSLGLNRVTYVFPKWDYGQRSQGHVQAPLTMASR